MSGFPCPYLSGDVELTDKREQHVAARHPDLLPMYRDRIASTLSDPDQVRVSKRFAGAKLFSRWYDDLLGGKHVVVVVVGEANACRHWVITAYIARALSAGDVEWARS